MEAIERAKKRCIEPVMFWDGKPLQTMGDTMDALNLCRTQNEVRQFVGLYRQITKNADDNLRFGISYYDSPVMIAHWVKLETRDALALEKGEEPK